MVEIKPNTEQLKKVINGRYILIEEIGFGGMGTVYKAQDRLTEDVVALKQVVQYSSVYGDDYHLALAKEFQILAGLRHPNIISVLDYGFNDEKLPFFTMNYLSDTQTILEAAKESTFEEKLNLVTQLLQALAYLQRHGVLHRDLKPENVLVIDGLVKVLDFGLATNDLFQAENIRGTPLYMTPEQIEEGEYFAASDVYVVGVLMYEMVTGDKLFGLFDIKYFDRLVENKPNLEGVDPSLQHFLRRVLSKSPKDRPQTASDALFELSQAIGQTTTISETDAIRESYLQAAKFVGRATEMECLNSALQKAGMGQGSAWLIGGESGIGKSRLLRELQTQARVDRFLVLSGNAVRNNVGVPYQIWREPLRHLIITLPELEDETASVLKPLIPDIEKFLGRAVHDAPDYGDQINQERLIKTIANLFLSVDSPILLILEDLHWGSGGLLVLPFVIEAIAAKKLMLVCSYRYDERPELAEKFKAMNQLLLQRFDRSAIKKLSEAILGDVAKRDDVISLIEQETEGNAFFVVEVVRMLAENAGQLSQIGEQALPEKILPCGIRDIVEQKVAKLSQKALGIVRLAAVHGRQLDPVLISDWTNGTREMTYWLTMCSHAFIIEVVGGDWQFSHSKVRDGIVDMMSGKELKNAHLQVAQTLASHYGQAEEQAAKLAYHWEAAGENEQAAISALAAGYYAARQYLNTDAIQHFNQAFRLTKPTEVKKQFDILMARFRTHNILNNSVDAEKDLKLLHDFVTSESITPQQQAEVWLEHSSFALLKLNQVDQAILASQKAMALGKLLNDKSILGRAYRFWADGLQFQGRNQESITLYKKSLHYLVGKEHQESRLIALQALIYVLLFERRSEESQAYETEAQLLNDQIPNKLSQVHFNNTIGISHFSSGDYGRALFYYKVAESIASEIGSEQILVAALNNISLVYFNIGRYDLAKNYSLMATEISRKLDIPFLLSNALNNLSMATYWLGEYEQSLHFATEGVRLFRKIQSKYLCYLLSSLALSQRKVGAVDEAKKTLSEGLDLAQSASIISIVCQIRSELASIYWDEGDVASASKSVEEILPYLDDAELLHTAQHPFHIYWQCYSILSELKDVRASHLLELAVKALEKRANRIEEYEFRISYLTNVAAHCSLVSAYQAKT